MKEIRITLACRSNTKHRKLVRVRARLGKRKAEELAELLDGSSLAYVHTPGPGSPIGRCCICGGELSATVSEVIDGNEVPTDPEEVARKAEEVLGKQLTASVKVMRKMTKAEHDSMRAKKTGEKHAVTAS